MNKPAVEFQDAAIHEDKADSNQNAHDSARIDTQIRLVESTASIVSSYVGMNTVAPGDLHGLIDSVHNSLCGLMPGHATTDAKTEKLPPPTPFVDPKESVFPDYIVCLEDGKKLKMLRRHLKATYGMTPEEYRARWGLPADYPMTAPNYSAHRTGIAKKLGLGRKGQGANFAAEQEKAEAEKTETKPAPKAKAKVKSEPKPKIEAASTSRNKRVAAKTAAPERKATRRTAR